MPAHHAARGVHQHTLWIRPYGNKSSIHASAVCEHQLQILYHDETGQEYRRTVAILDKKRKEKEHRRCFCALK